MVTNTIALQGQTFAPPDILGMAGKAANVKNSLAQSDAYKAQEKKIQYATELEKSNSALRFVNNPQQFKAWAASNYNNPILGEMLTSMGGSIEDSNAAIDAASQTPEGFAQLMEQASSTSQKLSDVFSGQLNRLRTDRKTAEANARRAQETALIYGNRGEAPPAPAPTAAPTNNLPPAATAFPVTPPRNTLAAPEGSPTAMKDLFAPNLEAANAAVATPFSQPQGGGAAGPVADRTSPTAQFESNISALLTEIARIEPLVGRYPQAEKRIKELRDSIKFNQDQIKFARPEEQKFEPEFSKQIGKAKAEEYQKLQASAYSAAENLTKIYDTLDQIKSSDAITGFGADILKNIERARAQFSEDKKAGKRVSDTEILEAMLGSEVFPMMGALGIGAKNIDTPEERKFLVKVITGEISMNKDALIRLTEIRKNVAEKAVERYNKAVDKGELNKFFEVQGIAPQKIELPSRQQSGGGANGKIKFLGFE